GMYFSSNSHAVLDLLLKHELSETGAHFSGSCAKGARRAALSVRRPQTGTPSVVVPRRERAARFCGRTQPHRPSTPRAPKAASSGGEVRRLGGCIPGSE